VPFKLYTNPCHISQLHFANDVIHTTALNIVGEREANSPGSLKENHIINHIHKTSKLSREKRTLTSMTLLTDFQNYNHAFLEQEK